MDLWPSIARHRERKGREGRNDSVLLEYLS